MPTGSQQALPQPLPQALPRPLPEVNRRGLLCAVLYVVLPPRLRGAWALICEAHSPPGLNDLIGTQLRFTPLTVLSH